eukprot:scaffold896_cov100-Skeletonema_dohrnii-CCMP3373.AAC.1
MMILQIIICVVLLLQQFCHAANHISSGSIMGNHYHRHDNDDAFKSWPLLFAAAGVINSSSSQQDDTTQKVVAHHKSSQRALQVSSSSSSSPMEGSCISSTLDPGKQLAKGSYLCYPPPPSAGQDSVSSTTTIRYEFGINSSSQIALYAQLPTNNNGASFHLLWTATPPASIFSESGIQFMRMQGALGSLAGYNPSRRKIYDSHDDAGKYSPYSIQHGVDLSTTSANGAMMYTNVVSEKEMGSRLELTEDGVFILNSNDEVTFQIVVPPQLKKELVVGSIQGFIWDDGNTNDGIFGA